MLAKGYYVAQSKLSLSPLYWIELIVFLPREIIKASGFKTTTKHLDVITKIIQIFYWLISIGYILYKLKTNL